MPAAVRRFSCDRRTLSEYYGDRLAPERAEALADFDQTWLALLQAVPFGQLDADARIDWILLRARIEKDGQQRAIAESKRAEMAPLLPFAPSILALDNELRHMIFVNGADAAARVSRIGDQIASLTTDIEAGRL